MSRTARLPRVIADPGTLQQTHGLRIEQDDEILPALGELVRQVMQAFGL